MTPSPRTVVRRDPTRAALILSLLNNVGSLLNVVDVVPRHQIEDTLRVLADTLEEHRFIRLAEDINALADDDPDLASSDLRKKLREWRKTFLGLSVRVHRAADAVRDGSTPEQAARTLERHARQLRARRRWLESARAYDRAALLWSEVPNHANVIDAQRQAYGIHAFEEGWAPTRVLFRIFPQDDTVIALLPDEYGAANPDLINAYERGADYSFVSLRDVMSRTRPATPDEYRGTFQEMTRRGHDITVLERLPRKPR